MYSKSSPEMIKSWTDDYKKMMQGALVAEEVNRVVAYTAISQEKNSIYIEDLYVLPRYRKRGIATRLLATVELIKNKLNKKHLRVDVRKKDLPAKKLYNKLGFKFLEPKNKNSMKLLK